MTCIMTPKRDRLFDLVLVQKQVFTLWLSFGGQGGRVIVGLVGGPFMMEEQLMLNQTSGGAAGDGGAVGDGCQTLLLPG